MLLFIPGEGNVLSLFTKFTQNNQAVPVIQTIRDHFASQMILFYKNWTARTVIRFWKGKINYFFQENLFFFSDFGGGGEPIRNNDGEKDTRRKVFSVVLGNLKLTFYDKGPFVNIEPTGVKISDKTHFPVILALQKLP